MSNQRKSNFELLRIVSIVMILFHHYSLNAAHMDIWDGISVYKIFFEFIYCFGQIGVNCFVVITGYFMFNKRNNMLFLRGGGNKVAFSNQSIRFYPFHPFRFNWSSKFFYKRFY